jgi:hypothetical protein
MFSFIPQSLKLLLAFLGLNLFVFANHAQTATDQNHKLLALITKEIMKLKNSTCILLTLLLAFSMEFIYSQSENPMEPTSTFGSLKFNDGSRYYGQLELGQMSGMGTYFFSDGTMRTGYFQDNKYLADFIVTPPWHMVGLDFMLDHDYEMETFSMDLKVLTDVPDSIYLYIAPFGTGEINGTQYYGGIQTHCGGYYSVIKGENSGSFIPLGRAMIFSCWGSRESLAFRKAEGGVCESSGYEGDFVSVRNGFQWNKGTYTISLSKTKETVIIDSVLHTYVEMQIYDHKKKQTFSCGSLAFPGTTLLLDKRNYIFFELYSKRVNINNLPSLKFICENYQVNGSEVKISFVASVYNKKFPDYANATFREGKFTVELGVPSMKPLIEGKDINYQILHEEK